ncbi:hypothetical protein [Desulforamulus aquiferis]|uniref:Uncharacterized protein n=1 Tax=Desulforamulus aquiferis TaxID=1397668 RepID=A0AAW7Z782_9FIRM|nr:hypothetical protein [Desulforamulus aquiferis]MDO7785705.1 hypothetical protein [Desulforamulus aquiferis]
MAKPKPVVTCSMEANKTIAFAKTQSLNFQMTVPYTHNICVKN